MKNNTSILVRLVVMLLATSIPAFACGPTFPVPGECGTRGLLDFRGEAGEKSIRLNDLSRTVLKYEDLQIAETQHVLQWPGGTSSLMLIQDPKAREQATRSTGIGLAIRATQMRSRLTDKEWKKLVHLWARALRAESRSLGRAAVGQQPCTPKEYGNSLAVDAGYIVLSPIYIPGAIVVGAKEGYGPAGLVSVLGPVAGAVGLAADVVLLVPQGLKVVTQKTLSNQAEAASLRAASRFASEVFKYEKKYNIPAA